MGEGGFVRGRPAPGRAVLPQGLGEARPLAVVGVARGDGVRDLHHLPLEPGIEHRALPEPAVAPDEAAPAGRGGAERQVGAAGRRRGSRGAQGGPGADGAVAVLAADLQGVAVLAVEQPVAVGVLGEVAVRAVHPLLEVDVLEMDRLPEAVGIVEGDDPVPGVEEVALAVLLVDGAEDPAVAVVVGELGVLEGGVELRDPGQELRLGPQSAHGRALGVAVEAGPPLGLGRVALLLGPQRLAVRLVVPHRVAEIGVDERVRLVHVAGHALAGRHRPGEAVAHGMARLGSGDRRVGRGALPQVAEGGPGTRVGRVAVVGVDHVAGRAAAGAVIPRVVVGPQERQVGIVEPRLVEVDQRRADAQAGARSAVGEADVRPARLLQGVGIADVREGGRLENAPPFEGAEVLPGLGDLPAGEGEEPGKGAAGELLRGEGSRGLDLPGPPPGAVALPQEGGLLTQDAVGVGRRAEEDGRGGHRALEHPVDLVLMAGAAGTLSHPQVAGIDEADEFRRLLEQQRVGAFGIGGRGPALRIEGPDVGLPLRLLVGRAVGGGSGGPSGGGVAAVALRAADLHRLRGVDRFDAGVAGEAAARQGVRPCPGRALPLETRRCRGIGNRRLRRGEGDSDAHDQRGAEDPHHPGPLLPASPPSAGRRGSG